MIGNIVKKAFTMAEILLVIAIIGVTAVLVVPNLSKNVDEDKFATKALASYNELNSAIEMVLSNYVDLYDYSLKASSSLATLYGNLTNTLKLSKVCSTTPANCFYSGTIKKYDNTDFGTFPAYMSGWYSFRLANGTSVAIGSLSTTASPRKASCHVVMDITGPDGPNVWGIDIFDFYIGLNGDFAQTVAEVNAGYSPTTRGAYSSYTAPLFWIVANKNMDYLSCASSLNWVSKTTCD